mmetsp:Transcript_11510/g.27151  ORF Transcript_11510/g.27151 Transcript_11510/m.27151 type:complete len:223 (+) Transcript_11510:1-669(+)
MRLSWNKSTKTSKSAAADRPRNPRVASHEAAPRGLWRTSLAVRGSARGSHHEVTAWPHPISLQEGVPAAAGRHKALCRGPLVLEHHEAVHGLRHPVRLPKSLHLVHRVLRQDQRALGPAAGPPVGLIRQEDTHILAQRLHKLEALRAGVVDWLDILHASALGAGHLQAMAASLEACGLCSPAGEHGGVRQAGIHQLQLAHLPERLRVMKHQGTVDALQQVRV